MKDAIEVIADLLAASIADEFGEVNRNGYKNAYGLKFESEADRGLLQSDIHDIVLIKLSGVYGAYSLVMPFGKHEGKKLGDIPLSYLDNIYRTLDDNWFRWRVKELLDTFGSQAFYGGDAHLSVNEFWNKRAGAEQYQNEYT